MADKKVVIGSSEGAPVKPGDLTKITSVINTDSAGSDATATSNIPRMKIKASVEEDAVATSAIPRKKISANTDSTGDDATATSTIPRMKVEANTDSTGNDAIETSSIPRMKINAKATGDSDDTSTVKKGKIKAKLEEDKPKRKTNVKLKPVVVGETAEAVAVPSQEPATPKAVAAPVPAHATAVPKGVVAEDETVKIQKPRSFIASTPVPGVKQTIKLRPSSTTPAPLSEAESSAGLTQPPPPPVALQAPGLAGASDAKRTIRLVPKKSDATSGGDQSSPAKPSAPTIKLGEPSRSASTVKLPSAGASESSADAVPKRTLTLLKSAKSPEATTVTPRPVPVVPSPIPPPPAPMPVPHPSVAAATDAEIITASAGEEWKIPPVVEAKVQKEVVPSTTVAPAGKQEPSVIFTIAACVAFFVMAYFTWMVVGQYCNNYMDSKIFVPGLSGKVK